MDIGRAQALFAPPLFQEDLLRKYDLEVANDIGRSVRRAIIDHQYMEILPQVHDGL